MVIAEPSELNKKKGSNYYRREHPSRCGTEQMAAPALSRVTPRSAAPLKGVDMETEINCAFWKRKKQKVELGFV